MVSVVKHFIIYLSTLLILMIGVAAIYNYSRVLNPIPKAHKNTNSAFLTNSIFIASDGYQHPLRIWVPKSSRPKAILVCLHGFNDYSSSFGTLGKYLAKYDIKTIAYDQRGFGGTNSRGYWDGGTVMADDLFSLVTLLKSQEEDVPIFVLGNSMGGGVVLKTLSSTDLKVNGAILVAPAVRGRAVMSWFQRITLWVAAHTIPWVQIGGGASIAGRTITPSDNIPMLRSMRQDPMIIKKTIIATAWGLVNLMDDVLLTSPELNTNTLLLYGEKDEVIPPYAMNKWVDSLQDKSSFKKITYDNGYHMLLHDLQAKNVLSDINLWIHNTLFVDDPANRRKFEI
jgi:alpha-beta hydrolase superfamily lysophospholipase